MPAACIWRKSFGDSSLKLYYSFNCTEEVTETISRPFNIEELANIRFSTKATISEGKMQVTMAFSTSKDAAAVEKTIKINVTCKDFQYSERDINVPSNWSDWQVMGCKQTYMKENLSLYYTTLVFFISVSEYKTETIISKLYTDTDFTDFQLTSPEGSVAVHRACLAAHSDVFRAMMTGNWNEKDEAQIKMEGVTLQTLQHLKDYIYLGSVPDDGLCPLLLIARCYLMEDLEKKCIRKLAETVAAKDLYSLIEFACDNKIPELAFAVLQLTQDSVVEEAQQWKKISKFVGTST